MNLRESFSNSVYEQQTYLADCELSAFITAVVEALGPEQARTASEDWLEEADIIDAPPLSNDRNWHSVTVAAAARMASRFDSLERDRPVPPSQSNTSLLAIPSSDCFSS